jgi:hypothetical protein
MNRDPLQGDGIEEKKEEEEEQEDRMMGRDRTEMRRRGRGLE